MSIPVRKSNIEHPVSVGDRAPDISSISVAGGSVQELSLKTYQLAKNYVVMLFLPVNGPMANLVCRRALFDEFVSVPQKMVKELHDDLKTYVIGVVDATVDEVLDWMDTPMSQGGLKDLPFPVVCDPSGKFSCNFSGVWNSKAYQMMHRAHVIIDDKGTVRQITVNDPMVSRSVGEVFRQVTAFKYTDEHGEVCPADWTAGDEAITPDPQGSKEFFQKKHQDSST